MQGDDPALLQEVLLSLFGCELPRHDRLGIIDELLDCRKRGPDTGGAVGRDGHNACVFGCATGMLAFVLIPWGLRTLPD